MVNTLGDLIVWSIIAALVGFKREPAHITGAGSLYVPGYEKTAASLTSYYLFFQRANTALVLSSKLSLPNCTPCLTYAETRCW